MASMLTLITLVPYEGLLRACPRRTNRDQIDIELHVIREFGRLLNRAGHHVPYEEVIAVRSFPMRAVEGIRVAWRVSPPLPPLRALSKNSARGLRAPSLTSLGALVGERVRLFADHLDGSG